MGGGDLNLKKSWHPALFKNQERVWLEEKKAIEERKRTEQMRKEIAEEREKKHVERLHAQQSGRSVVDRVEWMYAAPGANGVPVGEEMEGYLLGKRRLDKLLHDDPPANPAAVTAATAATAVTTTKISDRDVANKVREDPLLQIKREQQAALQSMRQRQMATLEGRTRREPSEERHRHSRHRHREDRHERRHTHERPREHRHAQRHGNGNGYGYGYDRADPSRRTGRGERAARSRSPRLEVGDARAGRLSAMQADAEDLEVQRRRRLHEIDARDKEDREREQRARARAAATRGRRPGHDFTGIDLQDWIRRPRVGLIHDVE